jgi:hypothetical protein
MKSLVKLTSIPSTVAQGVNNHDGSRQLVIHGDEFQKLQCYLVLGGCEGQILILFMRWNYQYF